MGWRYKAGLSLMVVVVFIWVTSAEVTQDIFTDYKQPFAITYLGASLMVIYLPISFTKDWIYNYFKKRSLVESPDNECCDTPLKYIEEAQKVIEMDATVSTISKKDSEIDLSVHEEAMLLIAESGEAGLVKTIQHETKITAKQIAAYGFCIAPLWFTSEYLTNSALARTSVASATVLSSTSGLFTLFIAPFMGQDSLNVTKLVAVSVSIAGVVMTTVGKTWAADEPKLNTSSSTERFILGDVFGLLSAVTYALFTVLLKKITGAEGERIDVQKLFGYIGLFSLVALWWLVWPLTALGIEPEFTIPHSVKLDELVLANGLIGNVISDYFWALCVVWTTPLVATLGMSLTIPVAMVADMLIHGRHYSAIYIAGSVQVFVGFVIANIS